MVDVMHQRASLSPYSAALECLPGLFQRNEDSGHEYFFSELSHALNLLHGLNKQRLEATLCDVTICVGELQFPCHRNVLAACSPYFLAMFTGEMREKTQAFVHISGVDGDIMRQLITYAYTSDITITQDNAQLLLSAANMLQISSIREACSRFLETEMHPSNCLGIHCFAEAHACDVLACQAKTYTLEHFTEVAQYDEILLLPCAKMTEFIQSDELNVETEEVVLQAVLDWYRHDPDKRKARFADVLSHVRLPLVSPYFLFDKMESDPILSDPSLPECRALVEEAMKFFVLKDRLGELRSPRARPRQRKPTENIIIIVGGEIYNKNYLNSVDCLRLDEERWWRLKELPFSRCHHGTTVAEARHVYVTGGLNKEKHVLSSALRYEPALDRWIKVASMNQPRARHGVASLDGHVYVMGGYDGESRTATMERYDPRTNTWQQRAPMPVALNRSQAAALNGWLYVAGGQAEPNNQCVDWFWKYNPHTDTWHVLRSLPSPQCVGALISLRGDLYAVGGSDNGDVAQKRLSRYNVARNQWVELTEMIEPRLDAGVAAVGKYIYVLSGHDGENSYHHSIEQYDVDADNWTLMTGTTMPYGRCRFGCLSLCVPKS